LLFLASFICAQTSTPSPKPSADYSQEALVTEHYIESFRFENDGTGDAIAQYQKQLEVNPLDPYAHSSLGLFYSKLKRWNKAVPELEKAVFLQDKNPLPHISLGQAYIATGQPKKGMVSFARAFAISPTAVVWNNIAYSLAEQNVQLDRASQYSDAAINAIETQLRDINLDTLRLQAIGTTNLLYNVWDTKGWIEFQRGNLDTAERYILAAREATGSGGICEPATMSGRPSPFTSPVSMPQ